MLNVSMLKMRSWAQHRENDWTIIWGWNLGVEGQTERWWPLNPVPSGWRLASMTSVLHVTSKISKIAQHVYVRMRQSLSLINCTCEATMSLSREQEALTADCIITQWVLLTGGDRRCASRPSRTLTRLVEVLGCLSSPLQPGGIEVAPFVLGFISPATGASRRRRRRWRRRLSGETGRHFRLPLIQSEQPRHFNMWQTSGQLTGCVRSGMRQLLQCCHGSSSTRVSLHSFAHAWQTFWITIATIGDW